MILILALNFDLLLLALIFVFFIYFVMQRLLHCNMTPLSNEGGKRTGMSQSSLLRFHPLRCILRSQLLVIQQDRRFSAPDHGGRRLSRRLPSLTCHRRALHRRRSIVHCHRRRHSMVHRRRYVRVSAPDQGR